jgi:eukaryotic-like serine/threonine-protein kinase
MNKTKFHKQDWFIAVVIGTVFTGAALTRSGPLERLELRAYDTGVNATHRTPGAVDDIAIIAIDDASIAEIGRWPWPRSVLTDALDGLGKAKPRSIGLMIDLSESQVDPGLVALRDIRDKLDAMKTPAPARRTLGQVRALLDQAEKTLDSDQTLAQSLRRLPRLYLPMFVDAEPSREDPATALPDYLQRHRLAGLADSNRLPTVQTIRVPIEPFGRYARGVGHVSFRTDPDGSMRALRTVLRHDGQYYPALALLLAASGLNLDARHIEFDPDVGVKLGKLTVPTDSRGRVNIGFHQPAPGQAHAFPVYSFNDVRTGKVAPALFTNKIVLVGLTARQGGMALMTPTGRTSEPELAANAVASILNRDFYTRTAWALWAELGMLLVVTLYLGLALPRMSTKIGMLLSLLLLLGLLGAGQYLMVAEQAWLRTVAPALLLFVGTVIIAARRFVLGSHAEVEADSAQSNRMLGLTFQSQGQLDMAMDKFRRLPPDESVLDLIYHLALDFERKRQFNKAAAAYDYILDQQSGFRDCKERRQRAAHADQALVVGKTMILEGAEKPKLGRYVLEKEIGRGSMGAVYLGRDPKINRRVAIKTMSLSEDFAEGQVAKLRERFFREAETAGRLHHPNIVTVFDAGEEHDLAYIAMEYLEGKDLGAHIQPGKPLSFDWILDVSIKIADALAYAHENDVVHRDIKPTNIVYHEATGSIKVTDFGIARIMVASNTQTGTILGTPLYMSPEQIAGKHVDGRSDLFSFGSMLFELVTGKMPFDGDSIAALIHQITKVSPPDVGKLRPDTPVELAAIIKRLMQKDVKKRYQTADELADDLGDCLTDLRQSARA